MRLFYIIFIGFCLIGYSLLKPTLDQVSSESRESKEKISFLRLNMLGLITIINTYTIELVLENKKAEFPKTPYLLKKTGLLKKTKNLFLNKDLEIVQIYKEPEENATKFEPNVPAGDIAYFVKKNGKVYDYCSIYTSDVYGNILRSRKNNKILSIKLVIENNNVETKEALSSSD